MCIFSFHGCKNRTYSWYSKSIFFSKCISDGHFCRNSGHNRSQNCENLICFCPSELKYIHGKLNKIEFCYKFCRICHLGRLPAIIIDVLQDIKPDQTTRSPRRMRAFIQTHTRTNIRTHRGARWLSGRVPDSGARGPGFETYRRRVMSLSKTLYSPKVLVNYPGSDGSVPT